ncbi:MAG: hypothetical protein QOJ00_537 [Actinomycetota bacterium]|jgi:predicted short-subunit dehydrogenase-like oxidoreductase (DUF2520 family)
MSKLSFRVIGAGRAGGAMARALTKVGWIERAALGRNDDVTHAASDVDVLIVATPDAAIATVASAIAPNPNCCVVHLSGALGADVLAPHPRRATVHPLVALPDAHTGARRLLDGAWFALTVGGDAMGAAIVDALGGRRVALADSEQVRALHHAACCVAANHLTTLLGQVERLAAAAGVPVDAYLALARGAVVNVADVGAAAALTGPIARGDWVTVDRHRAAVDAAAPAERELYEALVTATRDLAEC